MKNEIDKYKKIMKDVNINIKNEEYLQNKVIEQEKKINEYEKKNIEMKNNFKNLNKENKEIKGQLLILQTQKNNIKKEFKLKNDLLNGLHRAHYQLVKERNEYKRQQNILDNEIKIMKINNNRINNIKINNNIKMQKNISLQNTIDNLTKEKKDLQEKKIYCKRE